MDDADRVRRLERRRHLNGDVKRVKQTQPLKAHAPAQRQAFNEFGGDEVDAVDFADFMYGEDVGMIERRGGARFFLETLHAPWISGELRRQKFERHLAM